MERQRTSVFDKVTRCTCNILVTPNHNHSCRWHSSCGACTVDDHLVRLAGQIEQLERHIDPDRGVWGSTEMLRVTKFAQLMLDWLAEGDDAEFGGVDRDDLWQDLTVGDWAPGGGDHFREEIMEALA